jgi:Iap family predicted aminopeptidase
LTARLALAIAIALGLAPVDDQAISGRRAKQTARAIAALGPRPAGSAPERRAGAIVAERFRDLGYRVAVQSFPLPRGGRSRNIVALTPGPPRALVVAHLDGVRAGPAANDNGSGVAAVLEIAGALRGREGVMLAALGAEERVETGSPLHLGSARLVGSISPAKRRGIRVALSLDMVGVGPTLNVRGIEAAPNRSARLALARARALGLRASYRVDTGQSDHAEMTRGGVPAAWLQWRWDECWHAACDVPDRLQGRKIAAAARLALASAEAALGER